MRNVVQRPLTIPKDLNDRFNAYCASLPGITPLELNLWLMAHVCVEGLSPDAIADLQSWSALKKSETNKTHTKILLENHRSKIEAKLTT